MYSFKRYLKENRLHPTCGCLMAVIDPPFDKSLINHGKKLVNDKHLYFADDDEYGREKEPHVTLFHGFDKDFRPENVLKDLKPFEIEVVGISMFQNEKFDVLKYDCKSDVLNGLYESCTKYGESKYAEYIPHITIGYVIKNKLNISQRFDRPVKFAIKRFKYSSPDSNAYYHCHQES